MNRQFWEWENARTIDVKDGIRAQSRSGNFATSWWGKRWLETLQGFGWDNRLQRGRSYARRGQVVDLKLGPGGVTAGVQGSRPRPYQVTIQITPLTDTQWHAAISELQEQPLYLGQLLGGEMPAEIEKVFQAAGASLFPNRANDLQMSCSCPDWAVPCKHLAAVFYLLAEWLDRDPFLFFELRGKDRETLLSTLRESGGADSDSAASPEAVPDPLSIIDFWGAGELSPDARNAVSPPVPQALLRALGDPPGWSGTPLLTLLRPSYAAVSARAAVLQDGEETP